MLQQLCTTSKTAGWMLTLLAATGCPSDDSGQSVRGRIGPGGGQLSSHDGVLTVFLPPGAVQEEVEVSIAPSDSPPPSFGTAYRVQPDIDLEIAAEISYRDELPIDPSGVTIGAIHRADFEGGQGKWRRLDRIELHEDNGLVVAVDQELSLYYTLLDPGGVAGTTTTGPGPGTTGDDATTDPTDSTDPGSTGESTETTGDTETGPLFHDADIQPIWDEYCVTNCHEPGGVNASLALHENAYDNLVGQASLLAATELVVPGQPAESYLMHKLDGTFALPENQGGCGCNGSGGLMPLGMDQLDASLRNRIRSWIEQGAER